MTENVGLITQVQGENTFLKTMNISDVFNALIKDKEIKRSTAADRRGNVQTNVLSHYRHYCHNSVCNILIDGNNTLISQEIMPHKIYRQVLHGDEGNRVPDIVRLKNGTTDQICEIKVRHFPINDDILRRKIATIQVEYGGVVNIIIFYPFEYTYKDTSKLIKKIKSDTFK